MKIIISAKCSDLFSARLYNDEGRFEGEYDGYVPAFMPGEHYGDYVQLEIEIETGRILNWKKPSKKEVLKVFTQERC